MKLNRIQELLPLLPQGTGYLPNRGGRHFNQGFARTSRIDDVEKLAIAVHDPAFGWHFIRAFVDLQKDMPVQISDNTLRRAYSVESRREYDPPVLEAIGLAFFPGYTYSRYLLEAGLLDPTVSFDRLALLLSLSVDTVEVYDQLFFNVRDRLRDRAYLGKLAWPYGMQVELQPDYARREDLGMLMRRASFHHGFESALEMAGLGANVRNSDSAAAAEQMKALLLNSGLRQVKHGMIHQNLPVVNNSIRLLTAQAAGGEVQSGNEALGLHAISMGGAIMDLLKSDQHKDVLDRRKLNMLYIDVEAKQKKAAQEE